jgi:TolB-like protein/DNA-binding winged helix-turn-helix (wHTH) protein/Tfp pilus assembly protein PilF
MKTLARPEDLVRFRTFELNLKTRELYRNGLKLKLRGHPIDVLAMLLERPGELVTREDLRKKLWPEDTFVDFEHGLNSTINRLREALGDKADAPRFIETLPRLGYRFITPVKVEVAESPPDACESPATAGPAEVTVGQLLRKRWMALAAAALIGTLAVLFSINTFGLRDRVLERALPIPKIQSIAVLPLASLSTDPEQEYFADGMTDALLTDLGRVGALHVISRQSIMRYKGSKKPLPEIARELSLDAIVEGTVQRSGGKVRITAQLLQAKTDRHLWADSYERDFRDVLSLQGEVAQDIAHEIEVTLSPDESRRLADAHTVNTDAYEAYLKGRFQWYNVTHNGFDEAEQYFQLALQKDPNYALAYAGLADVWFMRADSGQVPPSETMPKALAATLKAIQLDQNLSEPHVTLANIDALYERDWVSGEREFRLAIELNPNNANAHFMYADYLISHKRNQEWQNEIQRALALDPMNSFMRAFYGWHLIYLGHYDEAIESLQRSLISQPGFPSAHLGLWGAYYKKHMNAEAMQESIEFYQGIHDSETAAALKAGYDQKGYAEGMKRAADLLALRAQRTYFPAIRVARLYAHAGDTDKSLLWLAKAVDARETPTSHLVVGWDWDELRSETRFKELLRRMNFSSELQ